MSISKWAYIPEMCDGDICPGECDICPKADAEGFEIDEDDYINFEEEEENGNRNNDNMYNDNN